MSVCGIMVLMVGFVLVIKKFVDENIFVMFVFLLYVFDDYLCDEFILVNLWWKVDEVFDVVYDYYVKIGCCVLIEYVLIKDMNDYVWCVDLLVDKFN